MCVLSTTTTVDVTATTIIGDGTAVRGETPAEAAIVTMAAVDGSNQAVVNADRVPIGSSNNRPLGSGHRILLGPLLHALIHLFGICLMLIQKLNKMAFLDLSHLLLLLQLDQVQQILKLLSILSTSLSLTHLGTWTPKQHHT